MTAQLKIGSTYHNFLVVDIQDLPELSGTAYIMRHKPTSARLMWIHTQDTNRSFTIGFKTPPANDTGVFHILEHSVLCGSKRFPVKEPFVSLIKTSMQTFLNAMTFPDKTVYPVASTNVADLENLMDVYLDAVLAPAIYQRPHIFEQEGWHFEVQDGKLVYNGVVYNEMKGALSDPDSVLFDTLCARLFPDTAYRFESGGDPNAIPNLTYQEFLDTHARHYNLPNSYTILYGELDIERELAFINERFEKAVVRTQDAPNPLERQTALIAAPSKKYMATSPDNASLGLAFCLGGTLERTRMLAANILFDALAGSNEAPLKRAVLDSGLADEFFVQVIDGLLQPLVMIEAKGIKEGAADKLSQLIFETCQKLVHEGIEPARLKASISQAEFNLREGDWGSEASGVGISIAALSSWLYDDNHPCDYLRYQASIDEFLANYDKGYFETLLDEVICSNAHRAQVELVPTNKEDDHQAQVLNNLQANMTAHDLEKIEHNVELLRAEQERPDSPEALATLPQLTLADITDAPFEEPLQVLSHADVKLLYHKADTHKIAYVYHYFDLRDLAFEDLSYVGILRDLLSNLDTTQFTAESLDIELEENLGTLNFFTDSYAYQDSTNEARPYFVVGAAALSEKIDALATLPSHVWSQTRYQDFERMFSLLTQRRLGLMQYFLNAGHAASAARLETQYSAAARVSDALGGVSYYFFLQDLLTHWDKKKDELAAKLKEVSQKLFVEQNLTLSLCGSKEDLTAFTQKFDINSVRVKDGSQNHAQQNLQSTSEVTSTNKTLLTIPHPSQVNEAYVIASNVSYVCQGQQPQQNDTLPLGTWQVIGRALSFDYLWNEVRVKGGAYGCGFKHAATGIVEYWSYRDPNIQDTLTRYHAAGAWLEHWNPTPQELEGYIIATVAGIDAPQKPQLLARRQDGYYLSGKPQDTHLLVRAQALATTARDAKTAAQVLDEPQGPVYTCIFGPQEALDTAKLEGSVVRRLDE